MTDTVSSSSLRCTVGIDMGSSVTRLALLDAEKKMPVILRNDLSNENTPTSIAMVPGEARIFGDNAATKEFSRPNCVVSNLVSWLMNAPHDARDIGSVEGVVAHRAASYFLKNVLSFVPCDKLSVAKVAVAVPSGVSEAALEALKTATVLAGVPADRVVVVDQSEAVLAYFHHLHRASLPSAEEAPLRAIVVDVGRAYTSIVVGELTVDKVKLLESQTLAMGSESIDVALADHVCAQIEGKHPGVGMRQHTKSYAKILRECRKAKEMISSVDTARVQVESLKDDVDVNVPITRSELEELAKPFLSSLADVLKGVVSRLSSQEDATVRVEAIGSGWRCACIQDVIKSALNITRIGVSLDCNLAVAEGSAILALCFDAAIAGQNGTADSGALPARDDVHNVELENFVSITRVVGTRPQDEIDVLAAAEKQLEIEDEVIHTRIRAINALDSYILQTLEASHSCAADAAKQDEIRNALRADEEYVRDDCNGDTVDVILQRLADVQAVVKDKFPEIAAHYDAMKEEQRKKDEELERLSKLQSEDKELKSDPQRLRGAQQRREQGQTLFKQEHWAEAQTRFVQALAILGELYDTKDPENKRKKDEIALSCHLNIASCSIKLSMWRNALNNASSALELSPNHPKALFRRGQAASMMNEYAAARADLELARQLSGDDAAVVAELEAVIKKEEAAKAKEKKMFARMFA